MAKRQALTEVIAGLRDQVERLTERRGLLPAELDEVRRRLAEARADLGAAVLEGQNTVKLADAVAELEADERKLTAAEAAADAKLAEARGDLGAAEEEELVKRIVDLDAKFAERVADLLAACYELMDRAAELNAERLHLERLADQARRAGLAGRVPVLAAQGAGGFVGGVWRALRGATGPVELAVNMSGGPACLVAAVKERQKTHPPGSVR